MRMEVLETCPCRASLRGGLRRVAILYHHDFPAVVVNFRVVVCTADSILHLAHCRLNFALDFLRRASHLGSGVAGQVPDMTLGASYRLVDRAFHRSEERRVGK